MLVLERLFWIPNDFSKRTERNERSEGSWSLEQRAVESEAKAGVPFGVAEAEDVTALRSRRSDPKRLEWSEVSEENVGGIQKTSERTNSIFLFSRRKK